LTRRLKLIVEGRGDVSATTSLICKCADAFGSNVIVVDPPIRAGEAKKLRRTGELERYVTLAASHDDVEEIFILLDLDDGCVMEYEKEFKHRAAPIAIRKNLKLRIVFCVREFEAWFLANVNDLRAALPEYGIEPTADFPNAHEIRGAKESLRSVCKGRRYKPIPDQNVFVKRLNVKNLAHTSRSFRKFIKEAADVSYEDVTAREAPTVV
jgi:hypothetical protein